MEKTSDAAVTTVRILGREYAIRSRLDADDVTRLGAYVREKMEAVANRAPRRDLMHVAVLAALNIADDYFRSRDGRADDGRRVLDRMLDIEAMVDRAVGGAHPAAGGPEPSLAPDDAAPPPGAPPWASLPGPEPSLLSPDDSSPGPPDEATPPDDSPPEPPDEATPPDDPAD